MVELSVGANEAGQRADKLLFKYLNAAPASFVYKMMRKKNIVLNGKKMTGQEILAVGDKICIWFSDETIGKFHTSYGQPTPHPEQDKRPAKDGSAKAWSAKDEAAKDGTAEGGTAKGRTAKSGKSGSPMVIMSSGISLKDPSDRFRNPPAWFRNAVLYEDDQIILVNKPADVLSQRAEGDALSMNEYLIAWLLSENKITERQLDTFHPAFCNRLDRNTTGILAGGKTLAALQELSELFRTRRIRKYYLAVVCGGGMKDADLSGYLHKDEKTNKVQILPERAEDETDTEEILPGGSKKNEINIVSRTKAQPENSERNGKKWERIETSFHVLKEFSLSHDGEAARTFTLLKIHLITGKTHQIRAHLASIGHPIVGDAKYGRNKNRRKDAVAALCYFETRKAPIQGQMLHSCELDFPEDLDGVLAGLAGRQFICEPPIYFAVAGEKLKQTVFRQN